jgi:hypothetical protein
METLYEKQRLLKDALKRIKGVSYNWHDARTSMLEAVFSRGDRRLSKVLEEAYNLGCRFDSWMEMFDFDKWTRAFENADIVPEFYANRKRDKGEMLPWEMIDSGVAKEYLWSERQASLEVKTTPDCRDGCLGCGLKEARLCL